MKKKNKEYIIIQKGDLVLNASIESNYNKIYEVHGKLKYEAPKLFNFLGEKLSIKFNQDTNERRKHNTRRRTNRARR